MLLKKPRAYAEIYNDLDTEIVNLFRVLRDPDQAPRLIELLRLTPFARCEFRDAYQVAPDPVEQARRLVIRSYMGFGATGTLGHSTGFRASSNRSGTTPAHDWANYPGSLAAVVTRLAGVVIENGDALAVSERHDGPQTLHYFDPPYVHETRSIGNPYCAKHKYRHELDDVGHATLLDRIESLQGMVVLSGYASPLYDKRLTHWRRVERAALADGARARTEVLWINAAAANALNEGPLLALAR